MMLLHHARTQVLSLGSEMCEGREEGRSTAALGPFVRRDTKRERAQTCAPLAFTFTCSGARP